MADYHTTRAKMLEVSIIQEQSTSTDTMGMTSTRTVYRPGVRYEYEVDGQRYEGNRVTKIKISGRAGDGASIRGAASRWGRV